jgi:hypothetical protein
MKTPCDSADTSAPTPADIINGFRTELMRLRSRRVGHLLNLALAAYKHLILNGKSDTVRLQAANAIVSLPPVQARLGAMAVRAAKPLKKPAGAETPASVDRSDEIMRELERLLDDAGAKVN